MELEDRPDALRDLRPQAIAGVAAAALVLGLIFDLGVALGSHGSGVGLTSVGGGSFAVGLLTLIFLRVSVTAAVASLIGGLATVAVAATYQLPEYPLVVALAPLVSLLGLLFGPRGGLAGAALFSVLVVGLWLGPAPVVGAPVAEVTLGLVWVSALMAWLAGRPIAIAIDWSWSNYDAARRATEAMRDRQMELIRLNRSLDEAYRRIEEANADIERARRAAVAARRLRDRFAATVSHEMRTPLNIITGFAEVMVRSPAAYYGEPLPPAYREDVDAIYRSASHLSRLVDDILDLAQIEADQLVLRKEFAAARAIVDEAVEVVAGLFRARGLTLVVHPGDDAHPVHVDRLRVRQILINLLSNAARFTAEGGVRIGIRAGDGEVIVTIADTGAGIPPEHVERIFEEFGQAPAGARQNGGTGLGLTISKRLAELHGGSLRGKRSPRLPQQDGGRAFARPCGLHDAPSRAGPSQIHVRRWCVEALS